MNQCVVKQYPNYLKMRRRSLATLIAFMFFMNMSYAGGNDTEAVLVKVDERLDEGDFRSAFKIINEAIKADPSDGYLLTKRGELNIIIERFDQAEKDLQKSLLIDDQNSYTHFQIAKLLSQRSDLDSARWHLDEAIACNESRELSEDMLWLKGHLHLGNGELYEAETYLIEAGLKQEVSMNTMRDLAKVLHLRGRDKEAIIILKESLEMFGDDLESFINTGFIANEIGMYDEALDFLDEALMMEPTNPIALCNTAFSFLKLGELSKAMVFVKRSLDNDNTNAFAYRVKGEILMEQGENKKACKEFKKAINMGYTVYFDKAEITKLLLNSCQ